jgi:predicted transcriptional regulator
VKVGELENVINDLRLSQGATMVQDSMMKANPKWATVRDFCFAERRALKAEASAPVKSLKPVNGLGEGAEVLPLLRCAFKVKPKALLRNDIVHLSLFTLTQLSLPPASTPNLDFRGAAVPPLGVAVGGGFSLDSQQPKAAAPPTNIDFSQRGILSRTPPFNERLKAFLSRGAGDSVNTKQGTELAYGISHGFQLWGEKEPDLALFDMVIRGLLPPEIHYHIFSCVDALLEKLTKEDEILYQEIRKALPVATCERAIKDFLSSSAHCASLEDQDYLIFQMTLDCNIPYISYRGLFEHDADGDRGYFYKSLLELLLRHTADYYDDIEHNVLRKAVIEDIDEKPAPAVVKNAVEKGLADGSDGEVSEPDVNAAKNSAEPLISLQLVEALWEAVDPELDNIADLVKLLRSTIQGNAAAEVLRKQQAEIAAAKGAMRRQMGGLQVAKAPQKTAEEIAADEAQDRFKLKEAVPALRQIVLVRGTKPTDRKTFLGKRIVYETSSDTASHAGGLTPARDCMSVGGHSLATTNHVKTAPSNLALVALSRRANSLLPVVLKLKLMKRD